MAHITTNLVFRLKAASFSNGVATSEFREQFAFNELIERSLSTVDGGLFYYRALPFEQAFEFRLFNSKHQEIGHKGRIPTVFKRPVFGGFRRYPTRVIDESDIGIFVRPKDIFEMTNGVYEMEVRMGLLVSTLTNGLPDMQSATNLQRFLRTTQFGVLISEPLRVRINK